MWVVQQLQQNGASRILNIQRRKVRNEESSETDSESVTAEKIRLSESLQSRWENEVWPIASHLQFCVFHHATINVTTSSAHLCPSGMHPLPTPHQCPTQAHFCHHIAQCVLAHHQCRTTGLALSTGISHSQPWCPTYTLTPHFS